MAASHPREIPDFTSREWVTDGEAFVRIKQKLGDPDLSGLQLFEDMHAGRLGFGGRFLKLGPSPIIKNTSAILTPRFLEKYKFAGFRISEDGAQVQLWPMPPVWAAYRLFLFIKRADLDRGEV